jgi:hypothetical protein
MAIFRSAVLGVGFCIAAWYVISNIGGPTRYQYATASIRAAKASRVFIRELKLTPLRPEDKTRLFPKEAWLERVDENCQTIPFVKERGAGVRLCLFFDHPPRPFFATLFSHGKKAPIHVVATNKDGCALSREYLYTERPTGMGEFVVQNRNDEDISAGRYAIVGK